MSDAQVLDMPLRRFWLLHRNIDRIAAEEGQRALHIAAMSQSGEGYSDLMEKLQERVGEVVVFDEDTTEQELKFIPNAERDQEGFNALKMMGR